MCSFIHHEMIYDLTEGERDLSIGALDFGLRGLG